MKMLKTAAIVLSALFAHQAVAQTTKAVEQVESTALTHTIQSKYGFDETVTRLENAVKSKGMTVFAVVDHQAAAKADGLTMQPAKVIIFGTPKAGTPLMIKDPSLALQLPLKVLVTETEGKINVIYNDTKAIIAGTNLTFSEVENNLAKAEGLIKKVVSE